MTNRPVENRIDKHALMRSRLVIVGFYICEAAFAMTAKTLTVKSRFSLRLTLCLIPCLPVSSKPKQRETEPNFEGAMERLEGIVEQMESGKLPLEDLIVRYEEGMNLVKICQERLANAEQKIEIIARNSAGKTTVKDFEPTPEPAAPRSVVDEPQNTNEEIRLF